MSWYQKVADHIQDNIEDFVDHFFNNGEVISMNKSFRVNPCPSCGHYDCFDIAKEKNAGNCFSCNLKGSRINIIKQLLGDDQAIVELEKWSGIHYQVSKETEEVHARQKEEQRLNEMRNIAARFYHLMLTSTKEAEGALEKLTGLNIAKGQRAHNTKTIGDFKVGLSGPYELLRRALENNGFTQDEIEKGRPYVWIPEGNFVYPYFDVSGNVIRFNTKPYFLKCMGKRKADKKYDWNCNWTSHDISDKARKKHEAEHGHKVSRGGFSIGEKENVYYFHPDDLRGAKFAILVEGENDVQSLREALFEKEESFYRKFVVVGIGGNMGEGAFSSSFFRRFEALYECFDADDAGKKYRDQLNQEAADMVVKSIRLDKDFNDIDQYLKSSIYDGNIDRMIDEASTLDTQSFIIEREGRKHIWRLKNRKFEMEFEVEQYSRQGNQLEGIFKLIKGGTTMDRKSGGIDKAQVEKSLNYARIALSEHMSDYYNNIMWEKDKPARSFHELLDVIEYTKDFHRVAKQIAWYLYHADEIAHQKLMQKLQKEIKSQRKVAEILREVNGFENEELDMNAFFPTITLSQYLNVTHDDGFFYFSKTIRDNDSVKVVPCLLSNKKEEIRLDLMKKKDPQSLLLLKNRYKVPYEIELAIMDPIEGSLQPYWVEKWRNNELDKASYEPAVLIKEIEDFIHRCYRMNTDAVKVLALWIYATYFYMLFKSGFPYLMFSGEKGTGKSTLDMIVYLLSLNAKFALDITEASLFRMISSEGGTFILDEVEHLNDKKAADTNGYSKMLKGGYADMGNIFRTNTEGGKMTQDRFSAFGPKVISNINGIDDVINDRCITIKTYRVKNEKDLIGLELPHDYKEERRSEMHSITSRCVISSLEYFQDVHKIFQNLTMDINTGNARLAQILKPLVVMARFVGGDYEDHLVSFYEKDIKQAKENVASGTIEGIVRNVLTIASREVVGLVPEEEKWVLDPSVHRYSKSVKHDGVRFFEIDSMHLKVMAEGWNNGELIQLKQIDAMMRNILPRDFNQKEGMKRTTATLQAADENDSLFREFNGSKTVKVYKYFLDAQYFLDEAELQVAAAQEEAPLF